MRDATAALYALLKQAWPSGATFLHPDQPAVFEKALDAAEADDLVLARFYRPGTYDVRGMTRLRCTVDVCARTLAKAEVDAQALINVITRTPRAPGALDARTEHIPETSYHRINVSFWLLIDSPAVPTPTLEEGS